MDHVRQLNKIFKDRYIYTHIDLNEFFSFIKPHYPIKESPFLDYHSKKYCSWTFRLRTLLNSIPYGGYLEDRSRFFDSRHVATSLVHLGLDIWHREYTPIHCPFNGFVIYKHTDHSSGWGGRVDILNPKNSLVYTFAHLLPHTDKLPNQHDEILEGNVIGYLAPKTLNGSWSPHLHLQCTTLTTYKNYRDILDMDAYSSPYPYLKYLFPHPLTTL